MHRFLIGSVGDTESPSRLQHDPIVLGRFYVTLTQNRKIVEVYVLNILMNNFLQILGTGFNRW